MRILIYSHDTFGLGHLRRCRTLAHYLVNEYKEVSVLILSGSPIIGSFDFKSRVDFVRIPGVIKLRNGDYVSLSEHIKIEDTLAIRGSIIEHVADHYKPDLFLVDKEPLGLRGEIKNTLELLKRKKVPCILGLRDVLDDPEMLLEEWERKNAIEAIETYYDQIWVYGLPQICEPLKGLNAPQSVLSKMIYTGYLKRAVASGLDEEIDLPQDKYILVTPGGGGDGEAMVDWVLKAYESNDKMPYQAVIVFGPFMAKKKQAEFKKRIKALSQVSATTFMKHLELFNKKAEAVIAMGGYNTFCEILSFNKKALIIPRTVPRKEQYLRATRAAELGLINVLVDDKKRNAETMVKAIHHLLHRKKPSEAIVPGLLDGLPNVGKLLGHFFKTDRTELKKMSRKKELIKDHG